MPTSQRAISESPANSALNRASWVTAISGAAAAKATPPSTAATARSRDGQVPAARATTTASAARLRPTRGEVTTDRVRWAATSGVG